MAHNMCMRHYQQHRRTGSPYTSRALRFDATTVQEIRERWMNGEKQIAIARSLGVSAMRVYRIVRNKTYKV